MPPWETPSWFKLFKVVDADGSGLISYAEFLDMCRDILKLSEHMAPEPRLKALWLALDEDCSGYLTSGEFGSFMRLSAEKVNGAGKARQSVIDRNQRIAEELRLENLGVTVTVGGDALELVSVGGTLAYDALRQCFGGADLLSAPAAAVAPA